MQIAKWGDSLEVRLPKTRVEELGLKPGDELAIVEASVEQLTIYKRDRREELLSEVQRFHC